MSFGRICIGFADNNWTFRFMYWYWLKFYSFGVVYFVYSSLAILLDSLAYTIIYRIIVLIYV
jgi:hypothetical protein